MPADFKQGTNLLGGTLNPTTNQAATAEGAIYTTPAGSCAKIATAVVHNESATAIASIAIYKTPSGGTKRRISLVTNLAAGDSSSLFEFVGQFWEAGCVISAVASAVGANVDITGAVSS